MRGRALLCLACLQVITIFITYAMAYSNKNDSSGLNGAMWYLFMCFTEIPLIFIAIIILFVVLTGFLTSNFKRSSN